MKLIFSVKRFASCGVIIMVRQQREARSLAPPDPGKRTFGFAWSSPIMVELMFPYMSIWAPPRKV